MPTITSTHRSTKIYVSSVAAMGIPINPNTPLDTNVRIPNIDFSKDYIILWVPGTNDHLVPPKFIESIRQMFGDTASLDLCDYMATWRLQTSIANGQATLMQTLDYVKAHKKKSTKIFLAGLSQGSIIISDILANPKYAGLITRSVLVGHPGVADHHFDYTDNVREINNPLDFATFDWGGDRQRTIQNVDMFFRGDVFAGVRLLALALHHPLDALWVAALNLHRVPFLGLPSPLQDDPHNYTEFLDDAASFLYLGK